MVKQAAQIEYNRTKLAETTLTSPFDGIVIRRNRECGAVVNPGVSIMEIAATDEIWATVWVDETAVSKLKVGQKAQIVFRSQQDQPYTATVRRLSRETDRETREFLVDLALEKLPDNWTLGQRLEAHVMIGKHEDRLCVPTKMIRWEKNNPFVLVLMDGRITKRTLVIGLQTKMMTEVAKGLSPEDMLVLNPDDHLPHVGRKAEVRKQ
jgi:HlyD family secretion protein